MDAATVGARRTLVAVQVLPRKQFCCRACGAWVEWFKTITRPRTMLFDGGVEVTVVPHPTTGAPRWFLDRAACHWEHCPSK